MQKCDYCGSTEHYFSYIYRFANLCGKCFKAAHQQRPEVSGDDQLREAEAHFWDQLDLYHDIKHQDALTRAVDTFTEFGNIVKMLHKHEQLHHLQANPRKLILELADILKGSDEDPPT